jgi:hypothetical protein
MSAGSGPLVGAAIEVADDEDEEEKEEEAESCS